MSQFVRLIDHSIIDFFVRQAEDSRYGRDQLLKDSPYLLRHRESHCLFGYIPEESADSFVVAESFCNGENVVLQTAQCGGGNLGCEAGALTFAEAEVGLAILEHDFKSPASGIYPPCLEEVDVHVSGKQSVPFPMFGSTHKKDPYRNTSERDVKHDIVAFELAAVFLQLEFLSKLHKCGSREVSVFGMVFCSAVLADLYHAEPMASDVSAMYETYYFLIGKPTVGQNVTELYAFADGPSYHLLGKSCLGHVVFLLSLAERLAVVFGCSMPFEFFGTHAIVLFLSLLSDYGEIKKNLGYSVGHSHTEAFESKHGLVGEMGMHPSDSLSRPSCLLMVGVIKNQTGLFLLMVRTHMDAVPQLDGDVPKGFFPVDTGIFHEPVEDIFPCLYQWFEGTILLIDPGIFDAEAREQKKTLKYGEHPVYTVALACDGKCVTLGHPDQGENGTYVLHGCCHIRILEKVFDIREKWSNFVYRHGLEIVFWRYLKLLIFCHIGKKPCRFFMPLSLEISTCET